jgi:DNA primase
MISDNTVQRVKDLSIVDVLGKYVKLQRQGANYVCCCPFHGEKSPSLNVSPSKNLWHCFGCDRGGDAIKFVMELQNIEFHTAVEEIAKSNGVYVEYVTTERSEEQIADAKHRESLLIAIEQVQEY